MSTALKRIDPPTSLVRSQSLEEIQSLGEVLAKSGFFSDAKGAAQAVVKVLAGAELGFGPVASMTGIYIVKGRISLSANIMAASIKRSGRYNYRVRELASDRCEIEFFESGESIGVSTFTMDEAIAARLHEEFDRESGKWKPKQTWKNFPRNMLFARAMSNGAKWFCADIFGGPVYTPEELGAAVDGETGEVIDIAPEMPRIAPRLAAVETETADAPIETNPNRIAVELQRPLDSQLQPETRKALGAIMTTLRDDLHVSVEDLQEEMRAATGKTSRDELTEEQGRGMLGIYETLERELRSRKPSIAPDAEEILF